MQDRELRVVRGWLTAAIVVSVFHYVDNTIRWSDYVNGEPTPVQRWMVPAGWVLLTAAGLWGYQQLKEGNRPLAAALLGVYSASGLVGPVHYTAGTPAEFDPLQNILIVADTILGVVMLVLAVRIARTPGQPAQS